MQQIEFNSDCGYCWNQETHTQDKHEKELAARFCDWCNERMDFPAGEQVPFVQIICMDCKSLNYPCEMIEWSVGDLAIHDRDAKRPDMLMRVIKIATNDYIHLKYIIEGNKHPLTMKEVWKNHPRYLHRPERFGIDTTPWEIA